MKRVLIGVFSLLSLMVLFSSCTGADKKGEPKMKSIEVEVTYLEKMMLRPGSELTVTLEDVSMMDVAAEQIAQEVVVLEGAPPYNVTLTFDEGRIIDKHSYSVRATIKYMDTLIFTSTSVMDPFDEGDNRIVVEKVEVEEVMLEDTYWTVYRLGGNMVEAEKMPYILLNKINGIVNGYTSVNSLSGGYTLDGNKLVFGNLIVTARYSEQYANLEAQFVDVLGKTRTYEVFGPMLKLVGEDGETLAILKKRDL